MILKLSMKHQAMELYKVYLNHEPEITLTFFYGKVNLGCPRNGMGKIVTMSFEGQNLQ